MSITKVNQVAGQVTNNALTVVNPTWHGGDLLLSFCASLDSTITVAGYADIERAVGGGSPGLLAFAAQKFAAGTLGGASADSGANVVFNPAVLGAGHKTSGAVVGFRGVDQSTPINDHKITPPGSGGPTAFTGLNVTATRDGCKIVSIFYDKDSVDGLDAAPAAGWTIVAHGGFTTGGGKANVWVATLDVDPAAGSVGAVTWTCVGGAPASAQVITLALQPVSTTQTIVPVADRLVAGGVVGSPNAGAGTLYTNLNSAPPFTKRLIFPVGGEYTCDLSALNQPDAFAGFGVGYSLEPLGGAVSTNWLLKLIQDPGGTPVIHDSWTVSGVAAQTAFVHSVASTDADDIVFVSGKAVNLALYAKLTAAS